MDGTRTGDGCLRVVALDWSPLTTVMTSEPPHRVVGVMVKVMDIFANHLNFCYQVMVPPDGDWGRKLGHNNYSGLIGYINRGEAALTMVPLTLTLLRAEAMAFSEPLFNNEQRIIYKRPFPEAQVLGFVNPYTPMVWLWILFSFLVLCVVVCLVHMVSSSLHDYLGSGDGPDSDPSRGACDVRGRSSLHKSVLWTYSSLLSQSVPWWPEAWSVRVVAGMWLLVSLIVAEVYRSNLKAMLIMPTVSLPFDNLRQLLQTDISTYVILGSIFDHAMLAAPKNSSLARLKKQAMVHGNIRAAIADIHAGHIAAVASYSGLQHILHDAFSRKGFCYLYVTSETMLSAPLGLAFPKNSTLKPKVDKVIRGLKEFGIIHHLYMSEMPNASECENPTGDISVNSLRPLEMGDFFGIFALYAGGALLATFTFLLELLLAYLAGKGNKKQMRRK